MSCIMPHARELSLSEAELLKKKKGLFANQLGKLLSSGASCASRCASMRPHSWAKTPFIAHSTS